MDQSKPINKTEKSMIKNEALKKLIIRGLIIYLLVFNVFLFLRIVLRLVGADPQTAFPGFIYLISGIFLIPFFGMFPQFRDTIAAGQGSLDAIAVIAGFCTDILVILTIAVVLIGSSMLKTKKQATDTIEKERTIDTTTADQAIK